jgi:dTDP-4-amino-4,6-dideoxygalactose transaminase
MTKTPSSRKLALLGGQPAFAEKLHVGRPNIGDRNIFMQRVGEILDRRWFSNAGQCVREFESRVKDILGVRHCISICNATVALEIASRALDLNGEVIVPSFTFIATAHSLRWQGITPVFCDIDPETHHLDPADVERLITPRTTGIIGVHLWGKACATESLEKIAQKHGLKLMFDAAHAFGCSHGGRTIGNFGAAEVFSFHATKFINTGEGGAIVTNDDALAEKIRLMKNFGFSGYDNVIYIGTNGKMNEFSAAMGLTNLEAIDAIVRTNRSHYESYRTHLADCPGLKLIDYPDSDEYNFQYVVAEISSPEFPLSRDELLAVLHAENVLVRRYFYPGCHRMEPYRSEMPGIGARLPHTERLCERILVLPTGTALVDRDVSSICNVIRSAMEQPDAIRAQLSTPARQ